MRTLDKQQHRVASPLRGLAGGQTRDILMVILLAAFHLANNWIYLSKRVVIRGWDRPAHLVRTLIYNDILREVNVRTLFEAMTWSWNRPPLRHLSAVPFYRVFGTSTDVALMSNAVFMVILFLSVYGIGKRMYGRSAGLLAAFLVSMYPVLFGISRLSYVDYALTAMASLTIYFMVRTEGFVYRRHSVLLGISLGLGALTKWPIAAFVSAPVAYVAVRSRAVWSLKRDLLAKAQFSSTRRRLAASPVTHALASLILNAAWYVPNWDRLSTFPLGVLVFPASWLLVAATLYVLSRPSGRGANLLAALLVAAAVASLWSLPNIGFLTRFMEVAYGGPNIDQTGIRFTELRFYVRYLQPLYDSQLSPLYFVAFLVAISVLAYAALRNRSPREALTRVSDHGWVLILWFVVPFSIFTLSLTLNSRFDLALLPAVALITAHGLLSLRARLWRAAIVAVLVLCGFVQFFALSYDELAWLREATEWQLPAVGRVQLLGQGMYVELPASGITDPGYSVPPRVLEQVRTDMELEGRTSVQLGNLVNRTYSNNAIFNYLMYGAYPGIDLREFARGGWEDPPVYPRLFECDYLLAASGLQDRVWEEARQALAIIEESPSFFEESFEPIWEWTVPDGDTFYLYRKRYHLREGYDLEAYRRLGEDITGLLGPRDAIVLDPPAQVEVLGRFYTGQVPPYPLPRQTPLDNTEVAADLEAIAARHARIVAVFWDRSEADPEHMVEDWLNREAYRAWDDWYDAVQLVIYASGADANEPDEELLVGADLGEEISLRGYRLWDKRVEPGGTLRLTLEWEARSDVRDDYKVFVHLLDGEGRVVAQRDSVPVGGSRPTATWRRGEEISDNYGVIVPGNTHQGRYRLAVGMYRPTTGERLPFASGDVEIVDDALLLSTVEVVE